MQKSDRKKLRQIILTGWAVLLVGALMFFALLMSVSAGWFGSLPTFDELENPKSSLATEVYSADGTVIGKYFLENRTNVDFDEISPHMIHALMATEDIRFYRHSGIDAKGLARVLFKTIFLGRSSSGGGSTVSQQLAKNLFPRGRMESRLSIAQTEGMGDRSQAREALHEGRDPDHVFEYHRICQ